ncbi:MAG: patatin-like phospholipase family protein [Ekhidna sp.]
MSFKSFIRKLGSSDQNSKPHKLGIALGGGGARGFAHLGAIQGLSEQGIRPDMIAGTSAGAMVAAFIASGKEPKEIHDLLKEKDLFGYSKIQWPKEGLFSLDGLGKVLAKEISIDRIENMRTPLIITVSNLNKGIVQYLTKGNLVDAVLASGSIPFIFKPVEIDGCKCADGGIMDNLPLKPLLEKCTKVIAISISPIEETDDLDNLVKISARTFQLSVNAQNNELQKDCTLFIEPNGIREYDLFDIKKADELFEIGYESIQNADLSRVLD